jgi:hypothetical protein
MTRSSFVIADLCQAFLRSSKLAIAPRVCGGPGRLDRFREE